MNAIKSIIFIFCFIGLGTQGLKSQSIESIAFSAASSKNNNFQPIVGMPFSGYLSTSNGSLTVSAEYGENFFKHTNIKSEIAIKSSIKVYPNPTSDDIKIVLPDKFLSTISIVLYDLAGKKLFTKATNQKETSIDMSQLPVSTYVLQIKSNELNAINQTHSIVKSNKIK